MLLKLLSQIGFLKRKVKSSETYSNEEGIVYVKGEKKPYTGIIENYDLNGVLKIRNRYKKGKLDDFTEYYENGKLQKDVMYKNGMKEGLCKEYYEDGKLQKQGRYKNDVEEGVFKEYFNNGELQKEVIYKNGKKEGVYKEYYKDGTLEKEIMYKDGRREGIAKDYYEDGTLAEEIMYERGFRKEIVVARKEFFFK